MRLAKSVIGAQVRCQYPKTFVLLKGAEVLSVTPEAGGFCVKAIAPCGDVVEVATTNPPELTP